MKNRSRWSEFVIIRADIFVMSVFHPKAFWNGAKGHKTKTFIQMSCVNVGCDNGIELQNGKTVEFSLHQTVGYQLFSNVKPAGIPADGVAGVADVAAASQFVLIYLVF